MATQELSNRWRARSLSEEQWGKQKKMILAQSTLLSLVDNILLEMEDTVMKDESTLDQYSVASWAYLQAHRNGQKNTLKELKKLTQHLRK